MILFLKALKAYEIIKQLINMWVNKSFGGLLSGFWGLSTADSDSTQKTVPDTPLEPFEIVQKLSKMTKTINPVIGFKIFV